MNAQTKVEAATLASAMAAAFGEIEGATKTAQGQVGQQKYKYADLTAVLEAIKPALIKHALFFTQHPKPTESGITVETVLHHAGGEHLSLGELFVPANKQDAQGFGSALTYARRYALVTAFGVPVEDDDGNAAAKGTQQQSAVSPSPPKPKEPKHSALKTQLRGFVHELNGCGDGDELSAFLATPDAIKVIEETQAKLPHLWSGLDWPEGVERPEEFVPLAELIAKRERECAQATADYLAAG
jgi:ERF superfamily protein